MRTTDPLQFSAADVLHSRVSCRNPVVRKIPFREMLPMQLKDKVSGKKENSKGVACLPEMFTLFTCLSKTDFDTLKCPNEVKAFQLCYKNHTANVAEYKAKGSLGILVPDQKLNDMTSQQINTLLKKYPIGQFMKKIRW
ncbi:uncharacterized protein LOC111269140 [Varroa jacobsoni]|uniref:CHCH domain-containing protein n=1 Tax=Varroa destructor TaxID=109461 RepID=A0A7M7KVV7_VARDE|nr:uncharacterized protein LOC111255260 [Varroa destructor]XP_022704268.1 uncharacterized protein LOC111269140 [Varroa jacobsoni]